MKKFLQILLVTVCFSFVGISGVFAQLDSRHLSDKIMTHGYSLVDQYVKELPEGACLFPNGSFDFKMSSSDSVSIGPSCLNNQVWRTVSFDFADGTTFVSFLDGPIFGKSGTLNDQGFSASVEMLERVLNTTTNVSILFKSPVKLDLSDSGDFQYFIDAMFESIQIKNPLFTEEVASVVLPGGTFIEINSAGDDDPIKINNSPTKVRNVTTSINFANETKNLSINVDLLRKETMLHVGESTVITKERVEIKNSELFVSSASKMRHVAVSPSDISNVNNQKKVLTSITLESDENGAYYNLIGKEKKKLLLLFPVEFDFEENIDAETGKKTKYKKPFWSFLAW